MSFTTIFTHLWWFIKLCLLAPVASNKERFSYLVINFHHLEFFFFCFCSFSFTLTWRSSGKASLSTKWFCQTETIREAALPSKRQDARKKKHLSSLSPWLISPARCSSLSLEFIILPSHLISFFLHHSLRFPPAFILTLFILFTCSVV